MLLNPNLIPKILFLIGSRINELFLYLTQTADHIFIFLNRLKLKILNYISKNFGIELSSQEVPLQVLSSIYNVSQLSSGWISVVPLSTLKTPKQKIFKVRP